MRLFRRLQAVWSLNGSFSVEAKQGNFFLMHFSNPEDLLFISTKGPWSIDNSLLVVDKWHLRLAMEEHKLESFPMWVQFWGLLHDHHTSLVAESLGDAVGDIAIHDNEISFSSHLHYLRVRVHIDPGKPLVQNIRVKLDDATFVWVECKYEAIFRSSFRTVFGLFGHTVADCFRTVGDIHRSFNARAEKTTRMFGSRLLCTFDARSNELRWQRWIKNHRTGGCSRIRT